MIKKSKPVETQAQTPVESPPPANPEPVSPRPRRFPERETCPHCYSGQGRNDGVHGRVTYFVCKNPGCDWTWKRTYETAADAQAAGRDEEEKNQGSEHR